MIRPNPVFPAICLVLLLPLAVRAQESALSTKNIAPAVVDTMMQDENVWLCRVPSLSADTARATLRVRVLEKGGGTQVVQGATVLLKRDKDKMLGRVTKHDGRCFFSPTPATYSVRVQMTGLKTLEKTGITLRPGQVYDMVIQMEKNQ